MGTESVKRGEVWVANLNPNRGQEAGKIRPVVVILPLTTQVRRDYEPLRTTLVAREKLREDCQVMVDQARALDRSRFGEGPLTRLTEAEMVSVERSLQILFGLS